MTRITAKPAAKTMVVKERTRQHEARARGPGLVEGQVVVWGYKTWR